MEPKSRNRRIYAPAGLLIAINIILRLPFISFDSQGLINLLLSSYLIIILWIIGLYIFRWQIAILAPLLVVFEPEFHEAIISSTKDTTFCLIIFVSVATYYIGSTRHQALTIQGSGLALGASMMIYPHAIWFVPLMMFFNSFARQHIEEQYNPLSFFRMKLLKPRHGWYELWALLLGFIVLGILAGQTTEPVNTTADVIRDLGFAVSGVNLSLGGIFLISVAMLIYREKLGLSSHGFHFVTLLSCSLFIISWNPYLFEAVIRTLDTAFSETKLSLDASSWSLSFLVAYCLVLFFAAHAALFSQNQFTEQETWTFMALFTSIGLLFLPPVALVPIIYLAAAITWFRIASQIGLTFASGRALRVAEAVSVIAVAAAVFNLVSTEDVSVIAVAAAVFNLVSTY